MRCMDNRHRSGARARYASCAQDMLGLVVGATPPMPLELASNGQGSIGHRLASAPQALATFLFGVGPSGDNARGTASAFGSMWAAWFGNPGAVPLIDSGRVGDACPRGIPQRMTLFGMSAQRRILQLRAPLGGRSSRL